MDSYAALLAESKSDFKPDPKAKYTGLLEKKWTSVIRLQKKVEELLSTTLEYTHTHLTFTPQIMDLENRNSQLQEELSLSPARRSASQADWVPRAPARYTLTGHRGQVLRVAFHPLYSVLASASEDATVKIWDWETGEFERTLKGHTRQVLDVHFDSKGARLGMDCNSSPPQISIHGTHRGANLAVSCSSDLTIRIWDVLNEYSSRTLHGHDHSISSARFVPGDDFIVSSSRDCTIKLWDVTNGWCVKTLTGHAQWVRGVVPSDDGRLLASCSDDQVNNLGAHAVGIINLTLFTQTARIWDLKTGESKVELRGHENYLEVVVFAPVVSYQSISELSGIELVRGHPLLSLKCSVPDIVNHLFRLRIGRNLLGNTSRPVHETNL